jgi:hypothetical protein
MYNMRVSHLLWVLHHAPLRQLATAIFQRMLVGAAALTSYFGVHYLVRRAIVHLGWSATCPNDGIDAQGGKPAPTYVTPEAAHEPQWHAKFDDRRHRQLEAGLAKRTG